MTVTTNQGGNMYRRTITMFVWASAVLISAATVFPQQRAVMWENVSVEKRNLYNGAGGAAMKPNLRRVHFLKKETGGNNLKYRVRDASGRVWVAKIADES